MIAKVILTALLLSCTGCALLQSENVTTDPTTRVVNRESTRVFSFGSKSMLNGFSANKKTKTTSSLMTVQNAGTETEMEKLAPLLEAVVAGAVKGAK